MAKPYQRPDKQKKNKKGATKGSGGQARRALRGKGATPKAEDRVYHAAHKRKLDRQRRAQGRHDREVSDMVVGRNPVVECLKAKVPAEALYVVAGTGHDERLSKAVDLATKDNVPIDEVPDLIKQAFVSAEDKNFYTHPGYDPRGMAAAAVELVEEDDY